MTDEELQAIRERCEKATPGRWKTVNECVGEDEQGRSLNLPVMISSEDDGFVASASIDVNDGPQQIADAAFIAHARTDIPALLAEVDRLRAELTSLTRSKSCSGHF